MCNFFTTFARKKYILGSMKSIRSYIQNANKVAIFTHQSPDGDAMGSSLAMYHYVQSLGKNAQVIVPNERIGALGDKMLTLSRRSTSQYLR